MALDSKASFQARAKQIGLDDAQVTALERSGITTFAGFAYATTYQPGQADDAPLLTFLATSFGARPDAGTAASCRRLFLESHTLALEDLKSRLDRSESTEARTIPLAEKMERIRQQQTRLRGVTFSPTVMPSHALIDKCCQQMEDQCLTYIELTKCTSRQDETLNQKSDSSISVDPTTGGLRLAKKPKLDDSVIIGEHKLRLAFQRRALAYDLANIGSFHEMDAWTHRLFEKMNETPMSGYKSVSMEQIMNADRMLWIKMADETRSNLTTDPAHGKSFDVAWRRLVDHAEVMAYLAPLPSPSSSRPTVDPPWNPKGKGKGKQKGAGKGPIQVPDGCSIFTEDKKPICKLFNVGSCFAKVKPGKRCQRGLHICWKTACRKAHSGAECPI